MTPSAVFDAHEALAEPTAEMLESVDAARPAAESAEAIAARLIERLADVAAAARQAGASRAHIRVVRGGAEVTLTLDSTTRTVEGSKSRKVEGSRGVEGSKGQRSEGQLTHDSSTNLETYTPTPNLSTSTA